MHASHNSSPTPRRRFPVARRGIIGAFVVVLVGIPLCRLDRPAQAEPVAALARLLPVPEQKRMDSGANARVDWTESRCQDCHAHEQVLSHPVDVTPTFALPPTLPLDAGRLTCLTCHDSDGASHAAARAQHTPMLRDALTGGDACASCHAQPANTRAAQHATALKKAHLAWRAPRAMTPLPRTSLTPRLDPESQNCLSCHDGLISAEATDGSDLPSRAMSVGSHPVGVPYAQARLRQRQLGGGFHLSPESNLPPALRLLDGKVACTSCHSPYSPEKRLLVMSNLQSALCLSCHQQ